MSKESIKCLTTYNGNKILVPELNYVGTKTRVEFNRSFLNQDKATFNHGAILNIYIFYKLIPTLNDFDFALENCLFGIVKLTKNADIDKCKYSGYGIGSDARGNFLFPGAGFGQNVKIFGAGMGSSVHANNKCLSPW